MIALLILLAGPSQAQTEVCAGPLTPEFWRDAMDDIDEAIGEFNGRRANEIIDATVHELRCLQRPVDPRDLGRLARQRSLMAFYEQDIAETEAWALLAAETLGGAPWPQAVPVPDPYHDFVAAMEPAELRVLDGKGLVVPRKGAVLLDGRLLEEPRATLGMTHLLQIADKKGKVLQTTWQHGAAFTDDLLGEPVAVQVPRWYAAPAEPLPLPDRDAIADAGEPTTDEPEPDEIVEPVVPEGPAPDEPEVPGVPESRPERVVMLPDSERRKMFETREVLDGCDWRKQPQNVRATAGRVQINRHTYPVRSASDQAAFKKVLRKCGEFRAARRFDRWREARRKLSFQASRYKQGMINALLTEDKPRRKKKKESK